jgi:phenylalanyl-tRNA synthetase beta chain
VRSVLTGAGFDEMIWHGLVDEKLAKLTHPEYDMIHITNPSSGDLNVMRTSTIQSALMVIGHNVSHRNINLSLFEQGTAYFPPDGKQDFREEGRIMLAVTGATGSSWRETPRPFDFFDLKGAIGLLAEHFHFKKPRYESRSVDFFDDDLSYSLSVKGREVGLVGKVTDKILKKFGIKQPVYLAELDAEALLDLWKPLARFEPLPVFPAAPRDLAIVVNQDVAAGDLVASISKKAGELAESVEIFDVYAGKQIEKGKKSVAVAISYRSPSKSLSGEEVDERQQSVVTMLKKEFNAEIRDK